MTDEQGRIRNRTWLSLMVNCTLRLRVLPILMLVPLLVGCGTVVTRVGGQEPPPSAPPDSTPAPPEDRADEDPYEGMAHQEMEAIRDQWRAGGLSKRIPAAGPETAGSKIDIAGRVVELPGDAYIGGLWSSYTKAGFFWEIIRGQSTLVIDRATGEIVGLELALGEEDAFDFVHETLDSTSVVRGLVWGVSVSALLAGLGGIAYKRRRLSRAASR